ncbi:alpha/beta hydrolase family protein [Actinacidiphila bryophytorum]|uniref:Prolyl oligopeptidase family protein n=1 Tax=Actinacidiphila bryophytorum TaxID=1436133 RepID=A0A9W4H455_9ACTN|nr:alpha/beta hydrolase [Actinacidiphila bryophytorum]MBM9435990.1 alpha/beta hydrolase [Actinacidiphila bryophytorum]CAG7649227.1 Prolyl oligopeptidase family protein [Actinacidiphila bryophytorum]
MAADSAAPPPPSAAEAEEASAFGHAPVPADATARYGDQERQLVDFYRPRATRGADPRPAPLVAVLHGGAWRAPYDRAHISPLAAHLAAQGFAVASVEYRTGAPGQAAVAGRWPDTFDDVAAAVDALPELAVQALGADLVDPRRVVLTGHSAGGHLALWAAARHVLPPGSRWHRPSPPPLRGVVALAPIADFTSAMRLRVCSDAVIELLGGPDHLTARLPHTDPAALLPTGIPVTIVHGTTDIDVPPQVSQSFARAAAAAGEEVVTAWLPDVGHFPLIDPATPAVSAVTDEIAQLAW